MKFIRPLICLLSALLLVSSLTACGGITLTPDEGGLHDKENDIHYINASPVYEAMELGEEYGTLKLTDAVSFKLYLIPDVDPNRMLATEEGDIVYASNLTMPTLREMDPATVQICMITASTTYVVNSITDKTQIDEMVAACENAPAISSPSLSPVRNMHIRFESPEHPGFCYALTYVEYAEDVVIEGQSYGRYFLINQFEEIFAPVGSTIHDLLVSDEETDETATPAAD